MRGNTVTLHMNYGRVAQTGNLWQYDYGQRLIIVGISLPSAYEVHFANAESGNSKTVIGDSTGVDIPDEYLLTGDKIHVWVYLHDGESDGETEYHGIINVSKRARPTDQEPTPVQQSEIDQAIAALNAGISTVEGIAEGIPQTIDEALEEAKESGEFDGKDGDPGKDGVSPVITVTDITGGHRITIKDATGSRSVDVMDGEPGTPGNPGQPGADGVSPTVAVSPIMDGHRVTITDKTGPHSFDVMDGEKGDPGDPTELIDDTSTTATDKVWSASKTAGEVSDLNQAINQKQDAPASGAAAGKVLGLALVDGQLVPVWDGFPVSDVQVGGVSVLDQGVANVPMASNNAMGVMKVHANDYGIGITSSGMSYINKASAAQRKEGTGSYRPITPVDQHESAFYGLAKASGDSTQSASSNAVGTYTDAAKIAIQKMLGIYEAPWELIREDTVTLATAAQYEITVDNDGDAFELSNVVFMLETPKRDAESGVGQSGQFTYWFGTASTEYIQVEHGAWTQAANGTAHIIYDIIEQKNGLVKTMSTAQTTASNSATYRVRVHEGNEIKTGILVPQSPVYFKKVRLSNVWGTFHYKLYGKRKWTT